MTGLFEVILRNSIDRHLITKKGNNWLADAVQPGGYLDIAPGCEDAYHNIQEGIHRLSLNFTHDRLISKLTFGFWTYHFAAKEFAAAGSTLLEIFPNRPFGTRQKTIFQNLIKVNDLRNRIAHHEPICFDKTSGTISTNYAEKRYNIIVELLYWLGCNPQKILYGIDGVPKAIANILEIRPSNLSKINN
ncbi:CAAX protease [Niastella yeongjuensis]|uniref:CAAX protease n=1 Tax=Niastella yeongjuensis TaxID=354355 RepID=UPI0010554668|nr:CAAX protease [Niastella yeongjuensis]